MNIPSKLFLFFLLFSAPVLFAQNGSPSPLTLDLEESWQRMEEQNPALKSLLIDQAAALREGDNRKNWIPGISAGASLSRNSPFVSTFTNPSNEGKGEGDYWSLRSSVDLRLSLKLNQALEDRLQILQMNQLLLQRDVKIRDLRTALEKLYYQILAGARTIDMQERTLDLTRARLEQIETQYNQGLRSDLELLTAQIAAARDLPALQKARADQEKRLLSFRNYLGLDHDTPVELRPVPERGAPPVPDKADLLSLIPKNDQVRNLQIQLELAEISKELTGKNVLGPSLGVSLGWSTGFNPLFDPDSWTADRWNDSLGLGISLSLPLDARIKGSSGSLTLEKLDDTIKKLEFTREETVKKVENDLRSLMLDLELSEANIKVSRLNADLQEQNFNKVSGSFEAGRSSLLDLDNSRQELQKARLSLENEILNRNLLIIDLERLTGQQLMSENR